MKEVSAQACCPALSRRGHRLVSSPPAEEYLREHFARFEAPYDPAVRPNGYIPLCIAENKLVADLLLPRMGTCRNVSASSLAYDNWTGSRAFREQLARFLSRSVLGRSIRPEHVAVLAGAGSALEILFYVIADPGDGVLVPTPSYAGFWLDLEVRNELKVIPVHTTSEDGFRLTPELFDQALARADRPVRAIIFTSPDNPMGRVYSAAEVAAVLDWAEHAGVHVVADEIYALSVFGEVEFTSCASVRPALGDSIHLVWGFSKDFAASGLRCGVVVTENTEVMQGVEALAYWACCSGDTQHVLRGLISDDAWVERYLELMQSRLGASFRQVTTALDEERIPFLPSSAGFFLLCDLRPFLQERTWEAERQLWRHILDHTNVSLTPGQACHVSEPGFMRLCFAGVPCDTAVHGVHALGRALRNESVLDAL